MSQRLDVKVSKREQKVTITTDQGSIEVLVADLPASEVLSVTVRTLSGNTDIEVHDGG